MNPAQNPQNNPSQANDDVDAILARIRDVEDLTARKLFVPVALRNLQRCAETTITAIDFGWLSPTMLARLRTALDDAPKPLTYYSPTKGQPHDR